MERRRLAADRSFRAAGRIVAGRYRLLNRLGTGAMGFVYRAHDERLNRDVALKILDPGYSLDFIFRARFEREYGVTAQLHNDHNIPVYDAGAWNDQLYIAMMLVDGPDLGEVMKTEGPLELTRVVAARSGPRPPSRPATAWY